MQKENKVRNKKNKRLIILVIALIVIILVSILVRSVIINHEVNESGRLAGANQNSSLIANNIKEGITIGGITGTLESLDTSDATATPQDILYGKTAYVDGKKITGTRRTLDMLNVGDYIAYSPDSAGSYTITSGVSGNSKDQTISQEKLNWQIMSINDDGTVDLVSSTPTSQDISLRGAIGYNNGVFLLNDISAKQYSNKELGVTARSINIKDIEKELNKDGIEARDNYVRVNTQYGNMRTYTGVDGVGSYSFYPNLYAEENGSGINTTVVKKDGIDSSNSYYSSPSTENTAYSEAAGGLTVTQTHYTINYIDAETCFDDKVFYNLIFKSTGESFVASRYVSCTDYAIFGLLTINNVNGFFKTDMSRLFSSEYTEYQILNYLRPVVTLSGSTLVGTGDGTSADTAYQLIY